MGHWSVFFNNVNLPHRHFLKTRQGKSTFSFLRTLNINWFCSYSDDDSKNFFSSGEPEESPNGPRAGEK